VNPANLKYLKMLPSGQAEVEAAVICEPPLLDPLDSDGSQCYRLTVRIKSLWAVIFVGTNYQDSLGNHYQINIFPGDKIVWGQGGRSIARVPGTSRRLPLKSGGSIQMDAILLMYLGGYLMENEK
jgi:hypothetical protein